MYMWRERAVVVGLVSVAALAATPASGSAKGSAGANAGSLAVCQLKHGHTVLQRGTIRIFSIKTAASVGGPSVETGFGCLRGDRKAWKLWESTSDVSQTDNVEQIADTFIALHETLTVNADFGESLTVFDLRNGSNYSIASIYDEKRRAADALAHRGVRARTQRSVPRPRIHVRHGERTAFQHDGRDARDARVPPLPAHARHGRTQRDQPVLAHLHGPHGDLDGERHVPFRERVRRRGTRIDASTGTSTTCAPPGRGPYPSRVCVGGPLHGPAPSKHNTPSEQFEDRP